MPQERPLLWEHDSIFVMIRTLPNSQRATCRLRDLCGMLLCNAVLDSRILDYAT